MKKFCVIVFGILLLIAVFFDAKATSYRFEWSNSIVHIPVGDSIENYKALPTATLYVDDKAKKDAKITYLREGDWLYYLSNVNTSKVGEYEVWYKAYENTTYKPGTCPGYKCKVKFIVEDTKPPVLEVLEPKIRIRRGGEPDFFQNISVKDNYDTEVKLTYSTDLNKDKPGVYSVTIYAEDSSHNRSEALYEIEVYESIYPILTYCNGSSPIVIPLNEQADLAEYFTAYDEIDGGLNAEIQYPTMDTSKVGSQRIEVSVTNYAGLTTSIEVEIQVVDDTIPSIILNKKDIILDYLTDLSTLDFKQYIKEIQDNQEINFDNLSITHDIVNEVGAYHIWFSYTDGTNIVTEELPIQLISYAKPEILVEEVRLEIGNKKDLKTYITVRDASDKNVGNSLVIYDENVDYNKEGVYDVEAYAINSSGVSNSISFKVFIESKKENSTTGLKQWMKKEYFILIIVGGIVVGVYMYKRIKKKKSI